MDPASLKVTELKAELKKRGLAVAGLKKDLVERLTEALERENAEEEEEEEEAEEEAAEEEKDEDEQSSVTVDHATPQAVVEEKPDETKGDEKGPEADASSTALDDEKPVELTTQDVEMTTEEETKASEPVAEEQIVSVEASKEEEEEKPAEPEPIAAAPTVETAAPTPTPNVEPKAAEHVLEPATNAPTPLQPPDAVQPSQASIEADLSKRRKRSRSPSVKAGEVEAKKARIQEELPGSDDAPMADAAPAAVVEESVERGRQSARDDRSMSMSRSRTRSRSDSRDRREYQRPVSRSRTRSRSRSRTHSPEQNRQRPSISATTKDARFKSLFNQEDPSASKAGPAPASPTQSEDGDAALPSVHPATRGLYIRELVRPLQESQLKAHLVQLASKISDANASGGDEGLLEFIYLDGIKTHCFAIFSTVQACSRARNGVHGKLFPNERNRKPLFADYVPEEKIEAWVEKEKDHRGMRYVITYTDGPDGMQAIHEEFVSGGGNTGGRGPVPIVTPGSARPPADAPSGPRGRMQSVGTGPAPAGAKVISLDELFLSTKTKPKIYYKPVDDATVRERIARGPVEGEVRGAHIRKGSMGVDSWRGGFGGGGRGGRAGPGGRRGGSDSWRSGDRDGGRGGGDRDSHRDRDREREFERRDWVRDGGRGDKRGPYRERSPRDSRY